MNEDGEEMKKTKLWVIGWPKLKEMYNTGH